MECDSITFLPGPWVKADLKAVTDSRLKHKGLFTEGRDVLLCHDVPLPKDLASLDGMLVEQDSGAMSSENLGAEILEKIASRNRAGAKKLLEALPSISPVVRALSRLSPEPPSRLTVKEAIALAASVKELRKNVGVSGDEGLWQAVVHWPESVCSRLLLGVEVWERTERDLMEGEKLARSALEAVKTAGSSFPSQPISQASFISKLLPALEEKILGQKLGGPGNPPRPAFLGAPKGAMAVFHKSHGALCFLREEEVWGLQERARGVGRLLVEALLALKLPSDLHKLRSLHKVPQLAQKLSLKAPGELSEALLAGDALAISVAKEATVARARRVSLPEGDPTLWKRVASCPDASDKGYAILPNTGEVELPSDWEAACEATGGLLKPEERAKLVSIAKCSGSDPDEILLAWYGLEEEGRISGGSNTSAIDTILSAAAVAAQSSSTLESTSSTVYSSAAGTPASGETSSNDSVPPVSSPLGSLASSSSKPLSPILPQPPSQTDTNDCTSSASAEPPSATLKSPPEIATKTTDPPKSPTRLVLKGTQAPWTKKSSPVIPSSSSPASGVFGSPRTPSSLVKLEKEVVEEKEKQLCQ